VRQGGGKLRAAVERVAAVAGLDLDELGQRLHALGGGEAGDGHRAALRCRARVLSVLCLGVGTMVGYKRIVTTIGERIGNRHFTPAQGASAELVAAGLIGTAGFSGLPVSTTHILSSGVAGTMIGSGAGVQWGTVRSVVAAWVLTLPAAILLSGGLFWLLSRG